MFFMHQGECSLFLAIFTDDIVFAGTTVMLDQFEKHLDSCFPTEHFGQVHWVIGMQFQRDLSTNSAILRQTRYTEEILMRFGMDKCSPVPTPMNPGEELTNTTLESDEGEKVTAEEKQRYSSLVGALLYLSVGTRPDIAYAVNQLARFNSNPSKAHIKAGKRVLRYLRGTAQLGLFFHRNHSMQLTMFVDASLANCPSTRRSTTGYISILGGAISWSSKRQKVVCDSSAEAEYRALNQALKEVLYLQQLILPIAALAGCASPPTPIHEDNQAAMLIATSEDIKGRMRHVEIAMNKIKEEVQRGSVKIIDTHTKDMLADILTKAAGRNEVKFFCDTMLADGGPIKGPTAIDSSTCQADTRARSCARRSVEENNGKGQQPQTSISPSAKGSVGAQSVMLHGS